MGQVNWPVFFIVLVAVILVILGLIWIINARRLDRLHRTVIQSRLTLNEALTHRAAAASDFSSSGALDVAGAILLADASQQSISQAHVPLSDDGLEDGPGHRRPTRQADEDRLTTESNLSRTLRLVLDGLEEGELTEEQKRLLDELTEARENVRLARRFHNAFVDQARRLRSNASVRVTRSAGGAPMPMPVDMDDV